MMSSWIRLGKLPCLMLVNPAQNIFVIQRAVGHTKAQRNQVSIRVLHCYAVYVQEDEQCIGTDALVSIQKSMILSEGNSQ